MACTRGGGVRGVDWGWENRLSKLLALRVRRTLRRVAPPSDPVGEGELRARSALDFARKSPYPDPAQLYDDLYTDPINFA